MAGGDDFSSFLSDTDGDSEEDRAVEDLLSQAMDLSALHQIAAINCSSFSDTHDNLPYHLLNRFRKLQSLPPPTTSASFPDLSTHTHHHKPSASSFLIPHDDTYSSCSTPNPINTSKPHTSDSPTFISTLSSSHSRSPSPVRTGIACFCCSPNNNKQNKKKKKEKSRLSSSSSGDIFNEYDADFLKSLSVKEQKKIMRKAIKAEQKINREADKIVKWAKQASSSSSSRMMDHHHHVSGVIVDDQLSDLEVEQDTTTKT